MSLKSYDRLLCIAGRNRRSVAFFYVALCPTRCPRTLRDPAVSSQGWPIRSGLHRLLGRGEFAPLGCDIWDEDAAFHGHTLSSGIGPGSRRCVESSLLGMGNHLTPWGAKGRG